MSVLKSISDRTLLSSVIKRSKSSQPKIAEFTGGMNENSAEYYISQLLNSISSPIFGVYQARYNAFQKFLISRSRLDKENSQSFFSTLFKTISMKPFYQYTILIRAVISTKTINKMEISKKIALSLSSTVKPDDNEKSWENFEIILIWLEKYLKNRMVSVIMLLKETSFKWIRNEKDQTKKEFVSGIYLLSVLIKNFYGMLMKVAKQIFGIMTFAVTTSNSNATFKLVSSAIYIQKAQSNNNLFKSNFINPLKMFLNEQRFSIYGNIIPCLEMVFESIPEYINDNPQKNVNEVSLSISPLELFKNKSSEIKMAGLQYAPLYVRVKKILPPELIKSYYSLLKHRSPFRPDALISLSNVLFLAATYKIKIDNEIISKLKKKITKHMDIEQIVYAYIAILTFLDQDQFERESAVIFNLPISQYTVDGYYKYCNIFPNKRDIVIRTFLIYFDTILLDKNSSSKKVIFCFEAILKFNLSSDFIPTPLAIKYSMFLNSKNDKVRSLSLKFILQYQKEKPTIDVLIRLLSLIGSVFPLEENERYYLFKELNKVPEDIAVLPLIVPLLYDSFEQIKIQAMKYLIRLIHLQGVSDLIIDYLGQIEKKLVLEVADVKNSLRPFYIMCKAYSKAESFLKENPNDRKSILQNYVAYKEIVKHFANFLVSYLINCNKIPRIGLEIFSTVLHLSTSPIDVDQLAIHISNSLQPHSSYRRLDSVFNMVLVALTHTTLSSSIYERHSHIISKFYSLVKLNKAQVNQEKLLTILSSIGEINPKFQRNLVSDDESNVIYNTPMYCFSLSQSDDPLDKLLIASYEIPIRTFLKVINDDALAPLFTTAFNTLVIILKHYKSIEDSLYEAIIALIQKILSSGDDSKVAFILSKFPLFISVFGEKIIANVPFIINFICNNWNSFDRDSMLRTVKWINMIDSKLLQPYILRLAKLFVSDVLEINPKIAETIYTFIVELSEYNSTISHIVYPPLIKWIEKNSQDTFICSDMLKHLTTLLRAGGGTHFASQIIKVMITIVKNNINLHVPALDVIYILALIIGPRFILYMTPIQTVFTIPESHELYLVIKLYKSGQFIPQALKSKACAPSEEAKISLSSQKASLTTNLSLKSNSKYDNPFVMAPFPETNDEQSWYGWYETISNDFMSNNCSALSASKDASVLYQEISDSLFPIAFVLQRFRFEKEQSQAKLDEILKQVLDRAPNSIVRIFLNIIEINEALEIRIPIDLEIIAQKAMEVKFYVLALRAYETKFKSVENIGKCDKEQIIGELIKLNQILGLPLAANGLLKYSQTEKKAEFFERLGHWNKALALYQSQSTLNPSNESTKNGIMNCLMHLSRYEELQNISNDNVFAASAAFHLFKYNDVIKIASKFAEENSKTRFFIIFACVLNRNFKKAREMIKRQYNESCSKIFPALGVYHDLPNEDYEQSYEDFLNDCLLSEIEEIIVYSELLNKAKSSQVEKRKNALKSIEQIKALWNKRFEKLRPIPSVLHTHLCIRSLILKISEQRNHFKKLISISLKCNKIELARSLIDFCESKDHCSDYKILRCHLYWARGEKQKAINELIKLNLPESKITLASWMLKNNQAIQARSQIESYTKETIEDWEIWSRINMSIYQECLRQNKPGELYLKDLLNGLMECISKVQANFLPITLRVLNVLFRYGNNEIFSIFNAKIKELPLKVCSEVVIQLMSRLPSSNLGLRKTISDLIMLIGFAHPHAVLLPLMVSACFVGSERQKVSQEIIDKIKEKHPKVVNDLTILSKELQKVALTRWEAAVSKIEEASKLYVSEKSSLSDVSHCLSELDKLLAQEPNSFYDISFYHDFGHYFELASHWRQIFDQTNDFNALQTSWHYYINAFYSIRPIVNGLTSFTIGDASPYLAALKNSEFPVPGMFSIDGSYPNITSFEPKVTIISSKQRPRKIEIIGSDGNKYAFLLKAHEDTRLDERIMQLFSFINTLVEYQNNLPLRNNLFITAYKVIPLTPEYGLIGWVRNCITLFDIVKKYRENSNTPLDIEYLKATAICPDYDERPLDDTKLKAFLAGFDACKNGYEIQKELFTNAIDLNDWVKRRVNFSASLAITSIVGYIIGLGDRHLCNIMINTRSSKLVHIDFGDSFEVAQHRSSYPEKVPFRLTRVLRNALEISGIEGTYRISCENIMRIMRSNSEQIIGLLSAFIYDPLRQWTNLTSKTDSNNASDESSSANIIINRISKKLEGNDFQNEQNLSVENQVGRLIDDAINDSNLCQMFKGWYPWW